MDKDLLDILAVDEEELAESALLHEPSIDYVSEDPFDDAEDGLQVEACA